MKAKTGFIMIHNGELRVKYDKKDGTFILETLPYAMMTVSFVLGCLLTYLVMIW